MAIQTSLNQIPPTLRIIVITDTYDVMLNAQAYKKAVSKEEALAEIRCWAGTQFATYLVSKFQV